MTKEDKQLKKRLDSLGNSIAKREASRVLQMSFWGDEQRSVPNDFVRSALFSARQEIGKELVRDKTVFSQGGITVKYTGGQLTQQHLDVFEGIIHLAREKPEGEVIEFTRRGLLKLIGRGTGGTDHKRLLLTLTDLTATSITIKNDRNGAVYWGSLLPKGVARPDEGGIYRLKVDRDIVKLFERGYTIVEHQQRKMLARSPLAKHLQYYYASHKKPHPVTVEFLRQLTGSDTKNKKHFKASLKKALNRLVEVGFLKSWRIDNGDKVHVIKEN